VARKKELEDALKYIEEEGANVFAEADKEL
jgi:hypothetical protein